MWVPVDIRATAYLPKPGERQYTLLEALVAVQADYWYCRSATIAGYAAQWSWGRKRVRDFVKEIGIEIVGQQGRSFGQLRSINRSSNDPAMGHLTFNNLGQLGGSLIQQRSSNDPSVDPAMIHSYINNKKKDETTPLAPSTPEQQKEVEEYLDLATRYDCQDPSRASAFRRAVRKNIKGEGRGLTPERRADLARWRQLAMAVPVSQLIADPEDTEFTRRFADAYPHYYCKN